MKKNISKNKDVVCGDGGFWQYASVFKKHFLKPQNLLQDGEDFAADGIGECSQASCGDTMIFLIKVDNNKKVITDCRWQTFGCASSLASSSILSEMILENGGMTLKAASKISQDDIIEKMGGIPDQKIKCAVLGHLALRDAINDYERKNK